MRNNLASFEVRGCFYRFCVSLKFKFRLNSDPVNVNSIHKSVVLSHPANNSVQQKVFKMLKNGNLYPKIRFS